MVPEKDFSDLDTNYKPQNVNGREMVFHDGFAAPFALEGFPFLDAEGHRSRLPLEAAEQCIRPQVLPMSRQGAGEVLRFITDSTAIALDVTYDELYAGPQRRASTGFDLYIGSGTEKRFCGNQFPASQDQHAELLFSRPAAAPAAGVPGIHALLPAPQRGPGHPDRRRSRLPHRTTHTAPDGETAPLLRLLHHQLRRGQPPRHELPGHRLPPARPAHDQHGVQRRLPRGTSHRRPDRRTRSGRAGARI
ncbi:MAG: hypothetical protein L6W00_11080 [Lentisphaeria bacterium]|nr:MAG: hypothetical protein L6W00_11080 [Lentisphaeria bacterium]